MDRIFRQTKTKMISDPFYTYRKIYFTRLLLFVIFGCLFVCLYVTYITFIQYWNVVESLHFFWGGDICPLR